MRISFLALIVFLIPVLSIASDVYYVDPDAPDGGNGRYDNPWNSAQQINAKTFSTGDGVYIKVNTTLRLVPGSHDQIRLRLDGT